MQRGAVARRRMARLFAHSVFEGGSARFRSRWPMVRSGNTGRRSPIARGVGLIAVWGLALAVVSAPARGADTPVLRAVETSGGIRVDTGAVSFELQDTGGVRSLRIGSKPLVADNADPLVMGELFESRTYDGYRDAAEGKTIAGEWRPATHQYRTTADEFQAEFTGQLDFGAADAIACRLTVAAVAGEPAVRMGIELRQQGAFRDRFLRGVALRLPLALNERKRIVQGGDRGVQWDTRHRYDFHVSMTNTLMPEPDHNVWRLFAIDQNTAGDYHIWRSESAVTCPLSMQRGLAAPGWMSVYDEQAGLLFAYRKWTQRAPKSLRVDADGSGQATVWLWHAGLPALDLRSPQAAAVFGAVHETDWLAFAGSFADSRPDAALARRWGVETLASDPPARNDPPLAELDLLDAPAADADAPLVTSGVPLPRGALRDPARVRLWRDPTEISVQTRATAYWPDRSIKWLLLTFPTDAAAVSGGAGEGQTLRFDLTRRDGSKTAYRLEYGDAVRAGQPQAALAARQQADVVQIDTGPLQIAVGEGRRWLRSVKLRGREMLGPDEARSFVDFLRTDPTYPCMTAQAQGALDDGAFTAQSVRLEEAGPLRAVVRLEGMTSAQEPTRIILRLEAFAGRSTVRLFHTAEFLHKDPRVAFIRRMGVELPLGGLQQARVTVGAQDGPTSLASGVRAGLRQHSHLGFEAWHQAADERFLRVDQTGHRSRGWLDLSGSQGGVAVVLRDMWQQFPNELVADVSGNRLTAYFWPESHPVMDVRRYSNYPHLGQGESTPADTRWVAKTFYPNGPIVGISKTHELLLYFHGPDVGGDRIDAVAADFQRPPLAFAGGDYNVQTGVILPQSLPSAPGFDRLHANLEHFAQFWLRHQRLWGWYGFWDYGDVQHHYKTGYGWILPAERLVEIRKRPADELRQLNVARWQVPDYAPNQEWAFENGRWGWNNTEGLPGLYVQNHYLRTGDREVFFFAEAMARHFRDVDMRHDGQWFGLGTRHGVQHWSDGNHEERQTTHSEFRYIHYLTGDMRSRDFAEKLFQGVYSRRSVSIHAAHSGRIQGLLTWWEMTGSEDVAAMLAKYMSSFVTSEGICESPNVRFPDVQCVAQDRDVNSGNMFFWTFGAAHGLLEYYYLTHDPKLQQALIRAADQAIRQRKVGYLLKAVIFAARHASDPTPYLQSLEDWAITSPYALQVVPHNPLFYGGPRGMLQGSVSGSLFAMNDVPYLLSAVSGDPPINDRHLRRLQQVDQHGASDYQMPALDWQSAYDRDELREYLRVKHPQP